MYALEGVVPRLTSFVDGDIIPTMSLVDVYVTLQSGTLTLTTRGDKAHD